MAYSAGQADFKRAYEIAPIALTGGVAGDLPGGIMSVLSVLQALTFGGVAGSSDIGLDDTFANFYPIAGGSLIDLQIGNYPFANMIVAANCTIRQPLVVSMRMLVPVRDPAGYAQKTMMMTALKYTLDQHIQSGGTFSVATPSFFYDNVLLARLHDISGGETFQAQYAYQWDFIKPLVTLEDAAGAQNAMMSKLSSGGQTDGATSGIGTSIGNPLSGATPSFSPAASGAITSGAGVTGGEMLSGAGPFSSGSGITGSERLGL